MFYKQSETKIEINRRNSKESINMWKLNTLLNNQWVKGKKGTGEMRRYFNEMNEMR